MYGAINRWDHEQYEGNGNQLDDNDDGISVQTHPESVASISSSDLNDYESDDSGIYGDIRVRVVRNEMDYETRNCKMSTLLGGVMLGVGAMITVPLLLYGLIATSADPQAAKCNIFTDETAHQYPPYKCSRLHYALLTGASLMGSGLTILLGGISRQAERPEPPLENYPAGIVPRVGAAVANAANAANADNADNADNAEHVDIPIEGDN